MPFQTCMLSFLKGELEKYLSGTFSYVNSLYVGQASFVQQSGGMFLLNENLSIQSRIQPNIVINIIKRHGFSNVKNNLNLGLLFTQSYHMSLEDLCIIMTTFMVFSLSLLELDRHGHCAVQKSPFCVTLNYSSKSGFYFMLLHEMPTMYTPH